ncbi:MAG: DUF1565 domain-containing protein [Chitinivibrionales bacterium]|nr:DUF1565 domain-containing protein [Chitinivibrionales bacterium]
MSSAALAADYHVSPDGTDAGDGSQSNPWKTLAHAATQVAENDVINLTAGTFVETANADFPLGVDLIGAGSDQTTLKWGGQTELYEGAWRFVSDGPVDGNHIISDMTIDGDNIAGFNAIEIIYRNNVTVERMIFRDCDHAALRIHGEKEPGWPDNLHTDPTTYVTGFILRHSEFYECGRAESYGAGGVIFVATLEGAQIHNNRMVNEVKQSYGIKGWFGRGFFKGVKIFDNYFQIAQLTSGIWSGTAFAIELKTPFANTEIFNNFSYNCFSLVWPHKDTFAERTIYVHHNTIINTGTDLAIEATMPNSEIAYNYIYDGSNQAIAIWRATKPDEAATWTRDNAFVHHNVIENTEKINDQYFLDMAGEMDNVRIYNNTMMTSSAIVSFYGPHSYTNIDIRNNLFMDIGGSRLIKFSTTDATVDSFTFRDNMATEYSGGYWLWGYHKPEMPNSDTVSIDEQVVSDPGLVMTGEAHSLERFRPSSANAAVVDAGVDVGLPYEGSAPDIGAFEYGNTEMTIGADTSSWDDPVSISQAPQQGPQGALPQVRSATAKTRSAARFDLQGRSAQGVRRTRVAGFEIIVDEHGIIHRQVYTEAVK